MKAYKQAALAVVLASTLVEVDGFNLPTSSCLEPAIKQRQLVGSVRKLDVKSIKSSGKHFDLCSIVCVLC